MLFLQLWWTLMVLTGSTTPTAECASQAASEQLTNFHQSVNEARQQLQDLHSNYGQVQDAELYRPRRNSIDEMLASFAQDADKEQTDDKDDEEQSLQQAADEWFRGLKTGVVHGAGQEAEAAAAMPKHTRSAGKQARSYGDSMPLTELAKVKKKYKDTSDESMSFTGMPEEQPFDAYKSGASELDIKLKNVQQQLRNQEQEQRQLRIHNVRKDFKHSKEMEERLPQYGDDNVPEGVYEKTLARLQFARNNANNLSHEANYKLSKIEQEAAAKTSKCRYPISLRKRSSSGFNPMNEIKLKTSNRLMRKGMGPSLPSNALTDTMRAHFVDNMLLRKQRKMQRQKEQQSHENERAGMLNPYDTLNSPDESALTGSNQKLHLFDTPQSYDYRLPHFDQFHMLAQRDYSHSNARLKTDRERYKRQPEQMKQPEIIAKEQTAASKAETQQAAHKEEDAEDLVAKLAPGAEVSKAKAVEGPKSPQTTEIKAESSNAQLKTDMDNKKQLEAEDKSQLETKPIAPEQNVNLQQTNKHAKVKREDTSVRTGICKSHPDAVVKLLANKISQHASDKERDGRLKRRTWEIMQQENNNDAKHYKRRSKRSLVAPEALEFVLLPNWNSRLKTESQQASNGCNCQHSVESKQRHRRRKRSVDEQPQPEDAPHHKHTNKRSVESEMEAQSEQDKSFESESEPQLESKLQSEQQYTKLLDSFPDHNGNHDRFGSLDVANIKDESDAESLSDSQEQQSNFKDEQVPYDYDGNTFANSRYQVPMMNQRQNNNNYNSMAYQQMPMQQQQYQPQQQPLQRQQFQPPMQQQQQQQGNGNGKSNFNMSQFLNDIAKQQQVQQQQQQQHQAQHQQPLQHVAQQQQQSQLQQQQQPYYGVNRYFPPIFNKNKLNVFSDPCLTASTSAGAAAAAPTTITAATNAATTTMNPDCVPIPTTKSETSSTTAPPAPPPAPPSATPATSAAPEQGTTAAPPSATQSNPCNSPEAVKLNVSLNANVCSDPKTKQIYGNGSICMQPIHNELVKAESFYKLDDAFVDENEDADLESEERFSRQAKERREDKDKDKKKQKSKKAPAEGKKTPEPEPKPKPEKKQSSSSGAGSSSSSGSMSGKQQMDMEDNYAEGFDKLVSGRLSEDIVHAVFDIVSNDPSLDALLSVMSRNRKCGFKRPRVLYQIRNDITERKVQDTEAMVRRAMETISEMVDKQMRQRNCIPLRPDLVEFYNMIIRSNSQQQKAREKRESNLRHQSDYNQKKRVLDPTNIEQKSRIVKKLLRQYEQLPVEAQIRAADVRDELLMDLVYLRKMQDLLERSQRKAQLDGVLRKTRLSVANDKHTNYSSRFLKLLKTAEILKDDGEEQAKAFIGI